MSDMLDGMRILATVASVALLAASSSASTLTDIVWAPDYPISTPQFAAAAGDQVSPMVATNGDLSLAVWSDTRQGGGVVYATRLDRDGHPLDPLGLIVDFGSGPEAVVWNGIAFAVVIKTGIGGHELVTVGTDGRVSSPKLLAAGIPDQIVASSDGGVGRIVDLAPGGDSSPPSLRVLDGDGDPLGPAFVPPTPVALYSTPDLVGVGDSEVILFRSGLGVRTSLVQRFSFDGQLLSSNESQLPFRADPRQCAIAGGGGSYAIVRQSPGVAVYKLTAEGVWIGGAATLLPQAADDANLVCCYHPSIQRAGDHYVVAWHTTLSSGRAYTYAATIPLDSGAASTTRIAEWVGNTRGVALASSAGRTEIVTSVLRLDSSISSDLLGQQLGTGLTATAPEVLALSAPLQGSVAAEAGVNGFLVTWTEPGQDGSLHMLARRISPNSSFGDEAPLEVARFTLDEYNHFHPLPRVTSNGETYLVTWLAGRFQGRRLDAVTGQWLDPQPFLPGDGNEFSFGNPAAAAANGHDALVSWPGTCPGGGAKCLYARRVAMAGDPLASPAMVVTPNGFPSDPALASNGEDYLLAWSDGACIIGPPGACEPFRLLAARLRSDGTPIDSQPLILEDRKSYSVTPSVTWGGGRYTVVWSTGVSLRGARVTREGVVQESDANGGTPLQQGSDFEQLTPLLVTRGEELILITRRLGLSVVSVTWEAASVASSSSLRELGASPRTVILSSSYLPAESLAVAVAPAGFLLTYDRLTTDAQTTGGVARVFFRVLSVLRRRRAE
jgi:hypothetical protein